MAFVILVGPKIVAAQDNGITVGQPKVYDNQSLSIMLDQLNARLQQISVVDQQSLQKAFGLIQGSQQQDISRSFSASVSPPAAAASSPSPSASSSSPLPDLIAAPSYKPEYGESPGDLLSDQVDVSYQIFNLRMLLERSLTDRLKDGHPRRQAVVSFNVSLDPPHNASDASAYVEITLSSGVGPVALVASMPQEKTYNATALSSSSTAFGGSAVAKIVTVSYNQRKRNQIFYLYRDSDTLAIERPADKDKVTFGWVFRPVLGRRSVSPGMRQLFAVISLPETDKLTDTNALSLQVSAKTYWLHYDRQTATNIVRPGFWDWSAKNMPPTAQFGLNEIEVFPTAPVENWLHPVVTQVQLFQVTNGNTTLQISGENFFPGTTVTIGDKTFGGPQDGLFLKSSQTILVTANADILSRALNAVVNGRYGPATPLYAPSANGITVLKAQVRPKGIKFSEVLLTLGKLGTSSSLTLADVQDVPRPVLSINGTAVPYTPLLQEITVGSSGASAPYVLATVTVPNSLVQSRDNRVGIIFPLLGQNWYSEAVLYDDSEVQVTKMTTGKTATLLISRPGLEFTGNWRLILDKLYPVKDPSAPTTSTAAAAPTATATSTRTPPAPTQNQTHAPARETFPPVEFTRLLPCHDDKANIANGCYMLQIVADSKFLSDYKKFVLISDTGYAQTLDVPAATVSPEAPSPQPKITAIAPATVGLNEVVTVTITGTGLDAIKQVTFEGKPLTFWTGAEKDKSPEAAPAKAPETANPKTPKAASPQTPVTPPNPKASEAASAAPSQGDSEGKSTQLHVLLTRDVTGKEGHQELLLQVDPKTLLTAALVVSPAPTPAKSPKSEERKSP